MNENYLEEHVVKIFNEFLQHINDFVDDPDFLPEFKVRQNNVVQSFWEYSRKFELPNEVMGFYESFEGDSPERHRCMVKHAIFMEYIYLKQELNEVVNNEK